ncbi:flavohemoglobin expression-modulating QEGLA motif protein [Hydrogenimonas sp.]
MKRKNDIPSEVVEEIRNDLVANRPVRRALPGGGRIHIDRQLPFLCLYRRPVGRPDAGTERLAHAEASYMTVLGEEDVSKLVEAVAVTLREIFGTFLILEIWALPYEAFPEEVRRKREPAFRIYSEHPSELLSTVETLQNRLKRISMHRSHARVEVVRTDRVAPDGREPILSEEIRRLQNIHLLGVGLFPLYRDEKGETLYPIKLQKLRRGFAKALKHAFYRFSTDLTSLCPTHFAMLGRRLVTRAVWESDDALAAIDDAFDFLLQVTPVNSEEAWELFKKEGFRGTPAFLYRPRSIDITEMKRRLYEIPIDRIEDPTLAELFEQKRRELDRKLTMLADRDTSDFLYESIPTYGRVEESLLQTARQMLEYLPHRRHEDVEADAQSGAVDAETFAEAAREEIAYYKRIYPALTSTVQVRDDIVAGAMVSGGDFLISKKARFPKNRIEALLHHEIGTHILTYANGLSQPFKQLHTGLSGYDEMQEGLAVLAEYLCGEISGARLRVLAARVVAVAMLCEGRSFPELFAALSEEYDFGQKSAFTIATRVFRGGGLTKDAVYLRGLVTLLEYLHGSGPLEPLFVGKIAAEQIPLVEELQWRGVLKPPPLWPRYLEEEGAKVRLREIREQKLGILDLIRKGYI